jgi:hypothetical protein
MLHRPAQSGVTKHEYDWMILTTSGHYDHAIDHWRLSLVGEARSRQYGLYTVNHYLNNYTSHNTQACISQHSNT